MLIMSSDSNLSSTHAKVHNQAESQTPPSYPYYLLLPPELLLEVFIYICGPPEPLDLLSSKEVTFPGPFLLGKICRHWRQLVFSSPSLWTYIYLLPPSLLPSKKSKALFVLLEDYLRHSSDLPLTIRLGVRQNAFLVRESETRSSYRALYNLLVQECHRWKAIEVFDSFSLVEYMCKTFPDLPLLQSASFGTPIAPTRLDVNFLQYAPQLRSLSLIGMKLPGEGPAYFHLTHFTGSNLFCGDVLNILRRTPNLRSCVLVDMGRSYMVTSTLPSPKITLEHLESLTARTCAALEDLFGDIASLPALRDFRCMTNTGHHPPLGPVKHLLHRSRCKLETLQIGSGLRVQRGIATLLEPLLRQSETLTRLMLRFGLDEEFPENVATILNPLWPPAPSMYTSMFGSFQDDEWQPPIICPNLQRLEMKYMGGSVLPILQMLKNRWLFGIVPAPGSPPVPYGGQNFVKIASAGFPDWCRREVMLQLGEEIKEGLVVDFFPETPEEKMLRLVFDEV